MPCPDQTGTTRAFWSRRGIASNAVAAYEAARVQLRNQASRWAERQRAKRLRCPEGCTNPHDFRYSIEELAVRGHYSFRTELTYFRVEGRIHWRYTCDPIAPPEVEEEAPPQRLRGEELTEYEQRDPGGDERDADGPDSAPCTVTIEMQDASQRSQGGVFDWELDVTFDAQASNDTHAWGPNSCRITEIVMQTGAGRAGRTGHGVLDRVINGLDDAVSGALGLNTDLTASRYGLTITSDAGQATVRGTLMRDRHRLPLDAGSSPRIRFNVEAQDESGDCKESEFTIYPR